MKGIHLGRPENWSLGSDRESDQRFRIIMVKNRRMPLASFVVQSKNMLNDGSFKRQPSPTGQSERRITAMFKSFYGMRDMMLERLICGRAATVHCCYWGLRNRKNDDHTAVCDHTGCGKV
jgi:hypothetical protein